MLGLGESIFRLVKQSLAQSPFPFGPLSSPSSPSDRGGSLQGIISTLIELLGSVIPVVIGIGVVLFLWGVVRYIASGDDEEKRNSARNLMIYGIIGIFVMVGVWGLVTIVGGTFDIPLGGDAPPPPRLPELQR